MHVDRRIGDHVALAPTSRPVRNDEDCRLATATAQFQFALRDVTYETSFVEGHRADDVRTVTAERVADVTPSDSN